jgi:hypothetical protein
LNGVPLNKCEALLLITLLAVSSLLLIGPVSAQSIPKPSVPEFTLRIVARPYDVPPTATIDPYTGKTVITQGGYHVENKSIDVVIKNQPFMLYTANGSEANLYYQIQFKGHYTDDWQFYWPNAIGYTDNIPQSGGDYTVISVPIGSDGVHAGSETNFPEAGKVDFRVKALIGSFTLIPHGNLFSDRIEFNGEEGDWSNTQTITINETTPTVTPSTSLPSPSTSPSNSQSSSQSGPQTLTQMGLDWGQVATLALLGVIAVLLVFAVVFLRKRSAK